MRVRSRVMGQCKVFELIYSCGTVIALITSYFRYTSVFESRTSLILDVHHNFAQGSSSTERDQTNLKFATCHTSRIQST